tara:strand:- start:587 stop:721 length:135 start_codon:yes stop_codon:yes gene_type:complete
MTEYKKRNPKHRAKLLDGKEKRQAILPLISSNFNDTRVLKFKLN